MSELIFVEQEPMAGKEHPPRPGATIGREGCDITIPDPELSRRHARIRRLDSGVAIEDLGSTNGTFVNDQRITGVCELNENDVVRLGHTVWRLQAAAVATGVAGQRGDVPRPDFSPSAIRRVVPPAGAPAAFDPAPPPRSRGSAATRVEATVAAYVATALVAAGVIAYYITKPFE